MRFTDREIATILAALRYWQDDLGEYPDLLQGGHFEEVSPLTTGEIDILCERFNFPEEDDHDTTAR